MRPSHVSRVLVVAGLVALLSAGAFGEPARAAGSGQYQRLAAQWWAWALSFPPSGSPLIDPDGSRCSLGEQPGNLFFLAGTFDPQGSTVVRACTVPTGVSLFFPVFNSFCAEPPGAVRQQKATQTACTSTSVDEIDPAGLTATVDDVPVPIVRARSALFPLVLPEDNLFGCPECAGHYQEVADGYWVLLDPLSPGVHTIHFAAAGILDVTYVVTVA